MKYTGKLAKKIIFSQGTLLTSPRPPMAELIEKLPNLFDFHHVERGDWAGLALALAMAHVPGFQFQKRAGAPKKLSALDKSDLRRDTDQLMVQHPNLSVPDALRRIGRTEKWKTRLLPIKSFRALRDAYREGDPDFIVAFEALSIRQQAVIAAGGPNLHKNIAKLMSELTNLVAEYCSEGKNVND